MRNITASVHQRLLNYAKARGRPFNEVLQYYALERFLYRLGCSSHRPAFVLKGALMFAVWRAPFSRPTRDIDLLGHVDNRVENVLAVMREVCLEPVLDDGLRFAEGIGGTPITDTAPYEGVRVRFTAYLGSARVPIQVDIGFGDRVVPGPCLVRFPTILDFPPPEVQGYSPESTIAEKFHCMVQRGEINSRMKDFYDIWWLATHFEFKGRDLGQAIAETFQRRQTPLAANPVAFSAGFGHAKDKQVQWAAFVRRHGLKDAPSTLYDAVQVIAQFVQPVAQVLQEGGAFEQGWLPGGPWLECG